MLKTCNRHSAIQLRHLTGLCTLLSSSKITRDKHGCARKKAIWVLSAHAQNISKHARWDTRRHLNRRAHGTRLAKAVEYQARKRSKSKLLQKADKREKLFDERTHALLILNNTLRMPGVIAGVGFFGAIKPLFPLSTKTKSRLRYGFVPRPVKATARFSSRSAVNPRHNEVSGTRNWLRYEQHFFKSWNDFLPTHWSVGHGKTSNKAGIRIKRFRHNETLLYFRWLQRRVGSLQWQPLWQPLP